MDDVLKGPNGHVWSQAIDMRIGPIGSLDHKGSHFLWFKYGLERGDSKSNKPPTYITNNLPLIASLLPALSSQNQGSQPHTKKRQTTNEARISSRGEAGNQTQQLRIF